MSAQTTPAGMSLSEAAEERNNMVSQSLHRLQHLAWRGINIRAMKNNQFVVVCIHVDSCWRWLVDELMPHCPESEWQKIRATGQFPVARGLVLFPLCEIIAEGFPAIKGILLEFPPEGFVKCLALNEGGCTVYDVEPVEMY